VQDEEKGTDLPNAVLISVVVPTYQRADLLARCLAALMTQSFPASAYEILVCDDGPSDATREVVEAAACATRGYPCLRYLPVTATQGPASARNAGWRRAKGSIIAFTDDDTVPDRQWLTQGLKAFKPNVAAVAGTVEMPLPPRPSDYERDAARLEQAEFVTANCFVRRAALQAVGGFDGRYTMAWREDSDLHFSLLVRGMTVVRAPQARVLHPVRPASFGVSIGMQKKIVFDTLLYKKHPRLYRQRIRSGPPWFYLCISVALFAELGAIASGFYAMAGAVGTLWAGLTATFFIKRVRGTRITLSQVADLLLSSVAIPPVAIFWRIIASLRYGKGFP
jgi:cellulose synthase/poly-beta-1,6-N-acetylglucosamine synthase-like glycosyltransferase